MHKNSHQFSLLWPRWYRYLVGASILSSLSWTCRPDPEVRKEKENPEKALQLPSAKEVSQQMSGNLCELFNGCCFTLPFIEISCKQKYIRRQIWGNVVQPPVPSSRGGWTTFRDQRYQGTSHAKMGTIKDRNAMEVAEAEDIKKRWKNTQKNCTKKIFMTQIITMAWSLT